MANFNEVLYKSLGEKIRNRRNEIGLSQTQLSDQIDKLGRTSVSNIEKGKQQSPLHVIYEICAVLDIDIHLILPTYSVIKQKTQEENKNTIEEFLRQADYDDATKDLLKDILKDSK